MLEHQLIGLKAGDDATSLEWVELDTVDSLNLAFDHKQIICDAAKQIL